MWISRILRIAWLRHFWTRTTITIDKCFARRGHVVKPWERNKVLFKILAVVCCEKLPASATAKLSNLPLLYYAICKFCELSGHTYILFSSRNNIFIHGHWMGFTLRGTDQQLHRGHAGKYKVRQTWVLLLFKNVISRIVTSTSFRIICWNK